MDVLKYNQFKVQKNTKYIEMFPIFGYPKIELWISKIRIMDILNSAGFLDIQKWIIDIQKSNYRYPEFSMIFGYPKMYFYVFLDIQKLIIDIKKSICGYP